MTDTAGTPTDPVYDPTDDVDDPTDDVDEPAPVNDAEDSDPVPLEEAPNEAVTEPRDDPHYIPEEDLDGVDIEGDEAA